MDYSPLGSSVHGIYPSKNTGVGFHFLLQWIFPTQRGNTHLLLLLLAGRFFTTESLGKPYSDMQITIPASKELGESSDRFYFIGIYFLYGVVLISIVE